MKKDIPFLKVSDVYVAVTRTKNELGAEEWHVRIINLKNTDIDTVLVVSKGYGERNGQAIKTSTLRHMIDRVQSRTAEIIEPIDPSVFAITNEFWVSYYIGKQIYDKKFTFVAGSITESNLSYIDILEMEGIVHP